MQQTGSKKSNGLALIAVLYILGIFMGAIDTGIVTPARTIIQGNLGVDDKTGIWMINIFTLAYAAAIPIAGKLADRLGRKYIYLICIGLFGLGSLICGLSQDFASFPMLLTGRVIQAIGGGGIMPIANAEFGTSFPEEKRGMALGIIGGVYGIANILGSTFGSAILDIFGSNNWQFLFYINLPICLVVIILGVIKLPLHKPGDTKKIDFLGTLIIVTMIVSFLYGLKNIDFFNFSETLKNTNVYPFLLAFVILLPIFILIERKAQDPVLNLSYFTNPQILITLIVATFVGICMMGMIFVPQFSENALHIKSGSGGYFVTILGIFTGIGAPTSGKLVDKYGPKKVLMGGFFISLLGALFLAFIASQVSNLLTVIVSLALIGSGLGFVMGSPLNYMMLANTKQEDSNSALATLSLMRSIGTTIAPAIMIGFLANAGLTAQDNLMNMLPKPEADAAFTQEANKISKTVEDMKNDPNMKDKLQAVNIPDLSKMGDMNFDMTGDTTLPDDIVKDLQSADVTNIVEKTKKIADYMFDKNVPSVVVKIQDGVQKGIDGMSTGLTSMDSTIKEMGDGVSGMDKAIEGIQKPIDSMSKAVNDMTKAVDGMTQGIDGMKKGITGLETAIAGMEQGLKGQNTALTQMIKAYDMITSGQMPSGGQIPNNGQMPGSSDTPGSIHAPVDNQALGSSQTPGNSQIPYTGSTQATGTNQTPNTGSSQAPGGSQAPGSSQIPDTGSTQATGNSQNPYNGQIPSNAQVSSGSAPQNTSSNSGTQAGSSPSGMPSDIAQKMQEYMKNPDKLKEDIAAMETSISTLQAKHDAAVKEKTELEKKLADTESKKAALEVQISTLTAKKTELETQLVDTKKKQTDLTSAATEITTAKDDLNNKIAEWKAFKDSVPAAFDRSKQAYFKAIDDLGPVIEDTFQASLNIGFKQMYLTVSVFSILSLIVLVFYRKKPKTNI